MPQTECKECTQKGCNPCRTIIKTTCSYCGITLFEGTVWEEKHRIIYCTDADCWSSGCFHSARKDFIERVKKANRKRPTTLRRL